MQESKAAAEQKSSSKAEVKEAAESMKQAAKQSSAVKQEHRKAADADSDSDVEILEEDAPEKGSLSGFYRAIRETGRANVLLALQVAVQTLALCAGLMSCLRYPEQRVLSGVVPEPQNLCMTMCVCS